MSLLKITFIYEGLRYLKEDYTQNFICLLAGDGPLKEFIKQTIIDNHFEDNVKLIGFQTDIYPYIKLADIVALTSQKEGVPCIIMEAMALAKSIVATDVLGTRELVRHNETGYLVEYKNVEELVFRLHLMLTDGKKRIEFGINGRKLVEEHFY